jgi:hypothetical protein
MGLTALPFFTSISASRYSEKSQGDTPDSEGCLYFKIFAITTFDGAKLN